MRLRTESVTLSASRNVVLEGYVIEVGDPSDPLTGPTRRPAVIKCPGGGYNHISEGEGLPAILPFLSEGYQAFNLSYSINDSSRYPNPLIDISMAVRWVRANADRFHIDPDRIAILGFSAGGNCAAMLATKWNMNDWKQTELTEIAAAGLADLGSFSNRPNAAILCYATTDLFAFPNLEQTRTRESGIGVISVERLPESNPIDHVTPETCPTFLWHTAEDETVPAKQSIAFAQRLMEENVPVELHLFERGTHGLSVGDKSTAYGDEHEPAATAWVDLAMRWLNDRFETSLS